VFSILIYVLSAENAFFQSTRTAMPASVNYVILTNISTSNFPLLIVPSVRCDHKTHIFICSLDFRNPHRPVEEV